MALRNSPEQVARDESAVINRLRALIVPGTPDEQRRRRLLVLDNIRRGYNAHRGGEPQWLVDLRGRIERGEPLDRSRARIQETADG